MMVGADIGAARSWLYSRLVAGATAAALGGAGSIYVRRTPLMPTYPVVRIEFVSGSFETGIGAAPLWTAATFTVKAVGKDVTDAAMRPLASAIYQDLHAARGTVADGTVLTCVAASPISYDETGPMMEMYLHEGWLFDLTVET